MRLPVLTMLIAGFCLPCALAAPVSHPNLLLNRDEIEQVKAKIAKYPWAAAGLEKTREQALKESSYLNAALYYVFTGDKTFADRARGYLLGHVNDQTFGAWGISWGLSPGPMTWSTTHARRPSACRSSAGSRPPARR
jgi:hypothetical protein